MTSLPPTIADTIMIQPPDAATEHFLAARARVDALLAELAPSLGRERFTALSDAVNEYVTAAAVDMLSHALAGLFGGSVIYGVPRRITLDGWQP
jgi:hypothetical protein